MEALRSWPRAILHYCNIQNHGTTWILFKLRWTQSLKGHKERTKYKNCSDTFLMPILYFPRSLFFVLLSLLGFKFMKNRLHIFCTVECGSELAISWSWIRMQIRIIAIGSTTLLTKYACKNADLQTRDGRSFNFLNMWLKSSW